MVDARTASDKELSESLEKIHESVLKELRDNSGTSLFIALSERKSTEAGLAFLHFMSEYKDDIRDGKKLRELAELHEAVQKAGAFKQMLEEHVRKTFDFAVQKARNANQEEIEESLHNARDRVFDELRSYGLKTMQAYEILTIIEGSTLTNTAQNLEFIDTFLPDIMINITVGELREIGNGELEILLDQTHIQTDDIPPDPLADEFFQHVRDIHTKVMDKLHRDYDNRHTNPKDETPSPYELKSIDNAIYDVIQNSAGEVFYQHHDDGDKAARNHDARTIALSMLRVELSKHGNGDEERQILSFIGQEIHELNEVLGANAPSTALVAIDPSITPLPVIMDASRAIFRDAIDMLEEVTDVQTRIGSSLDDIPLLVISRHGENNYHIRGVNPTDYPDDSIDEKARNVFNALSDMTDAILAYMIFSSNDRTKEPLYKNNYEKTKTTLEAALNDLDIDDPEKIVGMLEDNISKNAHRKFTDLSSLPNMHERTPD